MCTPVRLSEEKAEDQGVGVARWAGDSRISDYGLEEEAWLCVCVPSVRWLLGQIDHGCHF